MRDVAQLVMWPVAISIPLVLAHIATAHADKSIAKVEDIVVEEVPEEVRGYEYFDLGTWIKVVVERNDDYADIGYKTQDEQTLGSGTASTPDDERPILRLPIVYGISLSVLVTVSVLFCCIGLANACCRKNRTESYTFSQVKVEELPLDFLSFPQMSSMSKPTPTSANTEDDTIDTSKSVSKEHGEERLPDVKTTTFKTTDRSAPEGAAEVSAGVEQDQQVLMKSPDTGTDVCNSANVTNTIDMETITTSTFTSNSPSTDATPPSAVTTPTIVTITPSTTVTSTTITLTPQQPSLAASLPAVIVTAPNEATANTTSNDRTSQVTTSPQPIGGPTGSDMASTNSLAPKLSEDVAALLKAIIDEEAKEEHTL